MLVKNFPDTASAMDGGQDCWCFFFHRCIRVPVDDGGGILLIKPQLPARILWKQEGPGWNTSTKVFKLNTLLNRCKGKADHRESFTANESG